MVGAKTKTHLEERESPGPPTQACQETERQMVHPEFAIAHLQPKEGVGFGEPKRRETRFEIQGRVSPMC